MSLQNDLNPLETEQMNNAIQNNDYDLDDIMPLKEYVERYPSRPWPTESAARWAIIHRKKNGLSDSGALLKLNGRLFIHKPTMFSWLMSSTHK